MILLLFAISSEVIIIDSPDTSEINLGYSFIIQNSDSLWCGDELQVRDSSYIIDYGRGILKVEKKCSLQLKLKFSHLDFQLNESYSRWSSDTSRSLPPENLEVFPRQDGGNLVINGNKGLFVDVRSGGSDISQSLWMKIGGRAGQFDVSGVLSDENIPQGAVSQSLREIDEIFIEANSDDLSLRMGDIITTEEEVDKKLLGFSFDWRELSGVAGVSKAKYGKITFKTVENKQGPYKITPEEGISGISIIRGSEQVWLNGELLNRGSEKDYIINYLESSLTFTPSVFLDNESVVLVLFQYSVYGESNIFYESAFESKDYSFTFTREEDFSEKDLIESYPDSGFGYRYSYSNVGEGNGDYSFLDSIFVYEGYKKGSYEVYFQWVGEGRGEYEYVDSLRYFLWTGDGPYTVKSKVPLGEEDNLFSFGLNKTLKNFAVSGKLKARRIRTPLGGDKKDGLSGNVKSDFKPYDFLSLWVDYSKKTSNFVVREWEGEKDLLKTWEMVKLPSDFLESGVKFFPNSRIEGSYTYGIADTARKDKIDLRISPLFFYWENIKEQRLDLKGGFRFSDYEISYRDLKRSEDYRREFFTGSKYLDLLYGLEGGDFGDTAKVYMGKTDLEYKNMSIIASHIYRKNLNTGQTERTTNGSLNMNMNLSAFYLRSKFDISKKKASIWERYYQQVIPGEGNYSFDSTSNIYYENPYGDYIRRIVYTGEERDSREYSTNISVRSERIILLNGYLNSTFSPDLMSRNDGSLSFKFPEKSKNRIFLRTDFKYSSGEDFWGISDRSYGKINTGWENNSAKGYSELGLTRELSTEEDKIGGFLSFWYESGVEIKLEELLTTGEDTLISSILEFGYRLFGGKKSGLLRITLGYNYYPDGIVNSYRMRDLYPLGFFYDLTSAITFDFTEMIHLVTNANIHKLSNGEIYYTGRIGVTADFSP
ncbi:hypothetical protein JW879_00075 [candidate division WOR-3 bacterium]|nr:hypothetical protein [candidate division WOR-3 bacterium]